MKIVFMGTPDIAVPTLETLKASCHEVLCVVTQPDQRSGRGMTVRYSPVKETALRLAIPCLQPERIGEEEVLDELEALGADIYCVAAYAQKIPDRLLHMARFGCINMHPSLLPKYRGSGPLRGPILNGDAETGVTVMQLVTAWDAGDILLQKSFPMDPKETTETLEKKCAVLGAQLMLEAVDGLAKGSIIAVPQDAQKATYLKQITKEAGQIHFTDSAVQIERQIRACIPWPSAYTSLEGKTFKIWEADALSKEEAQTLGEPADVLPGAAALVNKNTLLIRTADGYLKPLSVQLEGKKRMGTEEFLRGKKITQGTQFGNGES